MEKKKRVAKSIDLKALKYFKVYCFPPGYYQKEELTKYMKSKGRSKKIDEFLTTIGFITETAHPGKLFLPAIIFRVDGYFINNKKSKKKIIPTMTYEKGLFYTIMDILKR